MDKSYIFCIKKACKNRGLELVENEDGSISINGTKIETISECERYLEKIERIDFNNSI